MLKRDIKKRMINLMTLFFIIFIIFISIYFYSVFKTKVNTISLSLNSLSNKTVSSQLKREILGLNSIYISQLIVFLTAILSLLIGLRYVVKIYSLERKNALIDSLTQIYNRKAIMFGLKRELKKSERYKHPTSIAMVDLDFFKKYNDFNGHVAGDRLLKRFARILKENTREYDIFGRYGGEEFLIVFPETSITEAVKVCERIRQIMEKTRFYGQEKMPFGKVTVSIGLSEIKGKRRLKKETLIHNADLNLYKAKEQGRNRVIYE